VSSQSQANDITTRKFFISLFNSAHRRARRLDVKKRFTEEQIISFLKRADAGMAIKELCRKHGFSEASFHPWRSKFCGMDVPDAMRLLADALLENGATKEALRKSGDRTGEVRAGARAQHRRRLSGAPARRSLRAARQAEGDPD
jgi:putative transposase